MKEVDHEVAEPPEMPSQMPNQMPSQMQNQLHQMQTPISSTPYQQHAFQHSADGKVFFNT
jgi:hypothetical protein